MRPLVLALLLPTPLLAQGGEVSAADPASVVAAIQSYGHKARLETADDGSPSISARGGDINYAVYFFGCENGTDCLDLQFVAGFDVTEPLTLDFVNRFNGDWVMGTVYLDDEGDPALSFGVTGTPSVSTEYFHSVLEVWTAQVDVFLDEIDW